MELALSLAWLAFVCWLLLRAANQRDLFPVLKPLPSNRLAPHPRVSVIVPARDEAANLERCLRDLLRQHYPVDRLDIIVVDDHSSDETLAIAGAMADQFRRLKIIECPALPSGWVGKSHACWIGARTASADVDWLCFIDADVEGEPDLMPSAISLAVSLQLDLLSLAPRQQLGSFAERLIIPCGLFLMAFWQNLAAVQSQDSGKVTATGQFLMVRRQAYGSVGGHAAVHDAICEDVALALKIKTAGGRVALHNGRLLLSTRMYRGWNSLWTGISKNLVEMLGGGSTTLLIACLAFVLSWISLLIPIADGFSCARGVSGSCLALLPAIVGSAAAFGLHIGGAFYFGIPLWYGLLFPLGYTVGACIAIDSLRRRWLGRIVWKDRTYP